MIEHPTREPERINSGPTAPRRRLAHRDWAIQRRQTLSCSRPPRINPVRVMIRKNRFRPCDVCRSRKTRCHPQEGGSCEYCTLHRKQCTFDQLPVVRPRASDTHATTVSSIENPSTNLDTPESCVSGMSTAIDINTADANSADINPHTLGFAQDRFAELYGLSSDMEPILMV